MEQLTRVFEEEVNRRVNDKINEILSKISQTYDISMKQLLRDIETTVKISDDTCHGLTKSGKKCNRRATEGYCKSHMNQKPHQMAKALVVLSSAVNHTHSLPPMFLAGCPACEKSKHSSVDWPSIV